MIDHPAATSRRTPIAALAAAWAAARARPTCTLLPAETSVADAAAGRCVARVDGIGLFILRGGHFVIMRADGGPALRRWMWLVGPRRVTLTLDGPWPLAVGRLALFAAPWGLPWLRLRPRWRWLDRPASLPPVPTSEQQRALGLQPVEHAAAAARAQASLWAGSPAPRPLRLRSPALGQRRLSASPAALARARLPGVLLPACPSPAAMLRAAGLPNLESREVAAARFADATEAR